MTAKRRDILARDTYLHLLRVHEALTDEFNALFKSEGISSPQYNVLRILAGGPIGGAPCQYIKDRLINRVPDVTRLVDRMQVAGLTSRHQDENDRRVVLVKLTAKGSKLCKRLDLPLMTMHRQQFDGLSRSRLEELHDTLQAFLDLD